MFISRLVRQSFLITSALLFAFVSQPSPARADLIIVDQSNTDIVPNLLRSIQFFGPIGQEFTPALPSLNVVELITRDFSGGPGSLFMGAELFVNIRSDTITGPILGTSATVSLPFRFGVGTDIGPLGGAITRFDFPSSVPLVPGELHIIEVVVASGDNWAVASGNDLVSIYPGGRPIVLGQPVAAADLWFREGLTVSEAVPEPSAALSTRRRYA